MKIVLTGATGKLGGYLARRWAGVHEVYRLTRDVADLRQPKTLRRVLGAQSFDALVNCAGMTSPEACEAQPAVAAVVNGESPEVMAEVCRERDARMVHFSTDYVLDGREPGLKDERAETGPVNQYGLSKLDGERRVLDQCPAALVCRVSWIFGTSPPGFLQTVLKRAEEEGDLEFVADKWSMPSGVEDIACATEMLLERPDLSGVMHLTNLGAEESWWSYGRKVIEMALEEGVLKREVKVHPTALADIPQLSAPRPLHTAMTPARLMEIQDGPIRGWEEAARDVIRRLARQRS